MSIYAPLLTTAGSEKVIHFLSSQYYLETDVVFGVFSNNCAGNGICRVTPKRLLTKGACQCCFGQARIYNYFKQLLFFFPAKGIGEKIRKEQFTKDFFLQEEPLSVSPALLHQLGLEEYTLHQGKHPLWYWENNYLVLFGNHKLFLLDPNSAQTKDKKKIQLIY